MIVLTALAALALLGALLWLWQRRQEAGPLAFGTLFGLSALFGLAGTLSALSDAALAIILWASALVMFASALWLAAPWARAVVRANEKQDELGLKWDWGRFERDRAAHQPR